MKSRLVLFSWCMAALLQVFYGAETGEAGKVAEVSGDQPEGGASLIDMGLVWDSKRKTGNVRNGEAEAQFAFYFTNSSSSAIIIREVQSSCGCTTLKLPPLPWTNASKAKGEIGLVVNVAGKSGTLYKTVTVVTDKGSYVLGANVVVAPPAAPPPPATVPTGEVEEPLVLVTLPATTANNLVAGRLEAPVINKQVQNAPKILNPDRGRNLQTAAADRQAVFKGDCVRCHVEPGKEKFGKALFDASCGICHNSPNRATMVPDLMTLKVPTDADFWRTSITYGKPGSLMPAFASDEGGPLTREQIESLVKYLADTVISQPNVYE